MPNDDFVVAQHDDGKGRGHAGLAVVLHALVVDRQIGRVEHLREELLRGLLSLGLAKGLQGRLNRQAAGHFAALHPAHAVGQDRDRAAAAFFLKGFRLPGADEIFVVLAGRAG